ncbi:methionyl-tRNA formyltransferase, mitochondrial-like isoform X2 [Amphiura filiformis]|uniref:methionyl-tRNA formyltransferase, mitochondrial-like isoform X2 n=1 Tax=Amphiura filiformis TaxID=82378 RepID=UPI003B21F019
MYMTMKILFPTKIPYVNIWPRGLATCIQYSTFSNEARCLLFSKDCQICPHTSSRTLKQINFSGWRTVNVLHKQNCRTTTTRHFSCSLDNGKLQDTKCKSNIDGGRRLDAAKSLDAGRRWYTTSSSVLDESKQPSWKVLFFGTDYFSLTCLQSLYKNRCSNGLIQQLDVVVPQSKYIKKRRKKDDRIISPVLQYAQQNGLKVYYWPMKEEVKGYDLGVVASFGHLIPGKIINSFSHGVLNVHPSLLPRWRGAAPIIHTILNNDAETGVTIMKLLPKRFDVGPVLHQKTVSVPTDCTSQSLCTTLADIGANMLLEVLRDLPTFTSQERPQTEDGATYGGKLSSEYAEINWSKSVEDICRQYRAVSFLIPLHTRWKGQHVVLGNMCNPEQIKDLSTKHSSATEGQICYHKEVDLICIKCRDGWVGFQHITIAYRQRLSAREFFNGYLSSSSAEIQYFS